MLVVPRERAGATPPLVIGLTSLPVDSCVKETPFGGYGVLLTTLPVDGSRGVALGQSGESGASLSRPLRQKRRIQRSVGLG
jgi:hypothetical protein